MSLVEPLWRVLDVRERYFELRYLRLIGAIAGKRVVGGEKGFVWSRWRLVVLVYATASLGCLKICHTPHRTSDPP
jgi:hypothetical protein